MRIYNKNNKIKHLNSNKNINNKTKYTIKIIYI